MKITVENFNYIGVGDSTCPQFAKVNAVVNFCNHLARTGVVFSINSEGSVLLSQAKPIEGLYTY